LGLALNYKNFIHAYTNIECTKFSSCSASSLSPAEVILPSSM
jgi:hypothetical protein